MKEHCYPNITQKNRHSSGKGGKRERVFFYWGGENALRTRSKGKGARTRMRGKGVTVIPKQKKSILLKGALSLVVRSPRSWSRKNEGGKRRGIDNNRKTGGEKIEFGKGG